MAAAPVPAIGEHRAGDAWLAQGWRSTRPGRISWAKEDVESLTSFIYCNLFSWGWGWQSERHIFNSQRDPTGCRIFHNILFRDLERCRNYWLIFCVIPIKLPQERVARDMRVNFPMDVTTLLLSPDWKGGPLVVLHNKLGRPPSAMLGKNHIWLLPFVKEFPSKAPDNPS